MTILFVFPYFAEGGLLGSIATALGLVLLFWIVFLCLGVLLFGEKRTTLRTYAPRPKPTGTHEQPRHIDIDPASQAGYEFETHSGPAPQIPTIDNIKSHFANHVPDWEKNLQHIQEYRKQDLLRAIADSYAANPGCVTDQWARDGIQKVQAMPVAAQYDAFELLYAATINGHPRGVAADVAQEILDAQGNTL